MKRIAIHSKAFDDYKFPFVKQVFEEVARHKVAIVVSQELYHFLQEINFKPHIEGFYTQITDASGIDLVLSVGGDGTLLEVVTQTRGSNVPILGINTGRLGFLATTARDQIKQALEAVFNGFYKIDERTLIQLECNKDIFEGVNIAMNEFTILKRDTSSMIVVHTYIDGEYLNSYWADGLIVATPTGSTGYSLSVGGPVVMPQTSNFIISPVSPHNLNVRPLIVPDKSVIAFEIEGRSKNFLVSLDSRSRKVDASIQLAIKRYEHKAKLVRIEGESFLKTLRNKLNWGMDVRNYQER